MEWPREYQSKDGQPILVRHAAYGDAPALHTGILQVVNEGIYIGVEAEGVRDLPAVIERLRRYLITDRMAQLVAEVDGQVVAALSLTPGPFGKKDRHWCCLEMWVIPEARGIGVGTALLETALDYGRDQKYEKAVVEVFSSNNAALALYRKFGFITEGRQKKLFALPGIGYVDNVLMALDL